MKISKIIELLEKFKSSCGDVEIKMEIYNHKTEEITYEPIEAVGIHSGPKNDGSSQRIAIIGNHV